MDRTNARYLTVADIGVELDWVVVDASFISLGKLMDGIVAIAGADTQVLALVKPQFEAGREAASRARGVIRDPAVRAAAIEQAALAFREAGFSVVGQCECSIPGPKGNREHFLWAQRNR
jgi:23S rRNA (cytidine1920-2'-O)/16S rRNA (cytidine1409-2'-O)-methyltransferase